MNTNILRALALTVTFLSGMVAYHTYFKATTANLVKLELTKSGQFVIKEGHIYALEELEAATIQTPAYSSGASQEYHLPTGRK